jgi:flagellin
MGSVHLPPVGGGSNLVKNLRRGEAGVQRALERLTTGKRINRPSDDPAGFIAAEELRGELSRMGVALEDIGRQRLDGRQRESTLSAIQTGLNDLRGLLVSASGALLSDAERQSLAVEINATQEAIDGLQGKLTAGPPDDSVIPSNAASTPALTPERAAEMAAAVDAQLDQVSWSRAGIAAHERYLLEVDEAILQGQVETHTAALSQIEDADFAEEVSNLAISQTLSQGALAAIALSHSIITEQLAQLMEALASGASLGAESSPPA